MSKCHYVSIHCYHIGLQGSLLCIRLKRIEQTSYRYGYQEIMSCTRHQNLIILKNWPTGMEPQVSVAFPKSKTLLDFFKGNFGTYIVLKYLISINRWHTKQKPSCMWQKMSYTWHSLCWSIDPIKKHLVNIKRTLKITILNKKQQRKSKSYLIEIVTQTIFMSIFLQFAQVIMFEF